MSQIICRDVSFSYGSSTVVSGLNFTVNDGEYMCIVGENGSGKSTAARGILGLKQPDSGSIEFGDGLKSSEIGYLPQQMDVQRDFPASVREVVLSGRLNSIGMKPFYSRKDKKDAYEKMKLLGIDNISDKCYRDLSGGQQQRVLLARAMCASKKLLLLDEPVTGLDPIAAQDMYELIADINKTMGMTIVMISHDIESTLKYATHILHISHTGTFFGTVDEYRKSEFGRKFIGGGC